MTEVRYAVLSFGGLFGMGERFYPLPWGILTYDTDKGGYVINLSREKIQDAPSFDRGSEPSYDRELDQRIAGHYGLAM